MERVTPEDTMENEEKGILKVRQARPEDAEKLLAIYAPYVIHTAVTYEYTVPSAEEFRERIRTTLRKYPYLAAEYLVNGRKEIVGYAYAGPFKTRAAYDWSVETSIYIAQDRRRLGIGKKLYDTMEEILKKQRILNLFACIAYAPAEDEYLSWDSVRFHERMGYRKAAEFHRCAFKFNRWYNMIWMEKNIGEHLPDQAPIIPFPELDL